ncbi:MAG: flagellar biosynthesis repressor FlbT [Pseudomonadota bacterium]
MGAGLVLRLRPNERFLVNGVVLENGDRRTRLVVKTENAHILRLRDAMHPDDANTPVKRLYYIAQLAVAGEASDMDAQTQLLQGLQDLGEALTKTEGKSDIDEAISLVQERSFYQAMRVLKKLIPFEANLLNPTTATEEASEHIPEGV